MHGRAWEEAARDTVHQPGPSKPTPAVISNRHASQLALSLLLAMLSRGKALANVLMYLMPGLHSVECSAGPGPPAHAHRQPSRQPGRKPESARGLPGCRRDADRLLLPATMRSMHQLEWIPPRRLTPRTGRHVVGTFPVPYVTGRHPRGLQHRTNGSVADPSHRLPKGSIRTARLPRGWATARRSSRCSLRPRRYPRQVLKCLGRVYKESSSSDYCISSMHAHRDGR